MSVDQVTNILRMQDLFACQHRTKNFALFFQYDYAESQHGFVRKYPTAILRGLAVLKGWEWFIDDNALPNIRLGYYDQSLHVPAGPAIFPATHIDQCKKAEPPGVMGYVYVMSHHDFDCLHQEQATKGRQRIYHTISFQFRSINETIARTCQLASMFCDMTSTRDGTLNLQDPFVNLHWRTGIKRMQQTGMMQWYVYRTWLKVKGVGMVFEPFLVVPNENAIIDPRAPRRPQSASSSAKLLKPQQELQQQQRKQKVQQQQVHAPKPGNPERKLSQEQREVILQQIFRHGSISKEQQSKLTERLKALMILYYLQTRQVIGLEKQKSSSRRNENVRIAGEQPEGQRRDAILSDVTRKHQQDAQSSVEESSRNDMPPPPPPARRHSQSAHVGNGRPSSAPANHSQNSSNPKRPASHPPPHAYPMPNPTPISNCTSTSNPSSTPEPNPTHSPNVTSHTDGAPDPKCQKLEHAPELKRPASNPNVNLSDAPEPKRKYAGRGRPRKSPIALPAGVIGALNHNQHQAQNQAAGSGHGYGRGKGGTHSSVMNDLGKPHSTMWGLPDAENAGYNHHGGNDVGNMNMRGSGDVRVSHAVGGTYAFPHVEAAAKMVDYFQDKVGVDMAGDGRMQ